MTSECVEYYPKMYEYFFPSPIILKKLCVKADRTGLFIVSFIRMLVYILIYFIIATIVDYNKYLSIRIFMLMLILINLIYLCMIPIKNLYL
jgi:hypothetical protein